MRAAAVLLSTCVGACVTTDFVRQPEPKPCVDVAPSAEPDAIAGVRAAVRDFVSAVERKDFETVLRLLEGELRARYSIERLERDFVAEPRGAQLVSRLKAAASARVTVERDRASLPVGAGRAVILKRESDGWHLVSLDGDSAAP